ncbi:MAG: hypothetical protein NWF01_01370 [Candidatus Bathyarchaeota archaeon]|nr:hypothetical protein [Candidatus Bathyarchaeota archaeon]
MSAVTMMKSMVKLTPHISLLILSLLWVYLTLGLRVRQTRRAFEKQLIGEGMSREDAKRLSSCFQDLKDNLTATVREALVGGFSSNRWNHE